MRNLVLFAATGAGSGYLPVAPGTAGALVGVALWSVFAWGLAATAPALLGITVLLTGLGIWAAGRAEGLLGHKDDQRITIDEVAGVLTALLFLPARLDVVVLAFVLFRVFDIWKPPPVRAAERLGGGLGVMADDIVAGLYANLIGQLAWRVLWPGGLL
jgi:phosphatidylglycerophosphatase A